MSLLKTLPASISPPTIDQWSTIAGMSQKEMSAATMSVVDGLLYATGVYTVYTFDGSSWSVMGNMPAPFTAKQVAHILDGGDKVVAIWGNKLFYRMKGTSTWIDQPVASFGYADAQTRVCGPTIITVANPMGRYTHINLETLTVTAITSNTSLRLSQFVYNGANQTYYAISTGGVLQKCTDMSTWTPADPYNSWFAVAGVTSGITTIYTCNNKMYLHYSSGDIFEYDAVAETVGTSVVLNATATGTRFSTDGNLLALVNLTNNIVIDTNDNSVVQLITTGTRLTSTVTFVSFDGAVYGGGSTSNIYPTLRLDTATGTVQPYDMAAKPNKSQFGFDQNGDYFAVDSDSKLFKSTALEGPYVEQPALAGAATGIANACIWSSEIALINSSSMSIHSSGTYVTTIALPALNATRQSADGRYIMVWTPSPTPRCHVYDFATNTLSTNSVSSPTAASVRGLPTMTTVSGTVLMAWGYDRRRLYRYTTSDGSFVEITTTTVGGVAVVWDDGLLDVSCIWNEGTTGYILTNSGCYSSGDGFITAARVHDTPKTDTSTTVLTTIRLVNGVLATCTSTGSFVSPDRGETWVEFKNSPIYWDATSGLRVRMFKTIDGKIAVQNLLDANVFIGSGSVLD